MLWILRGWLENDSCNNAVKAAILAVHALGLKTREKLGDAAFRRLHA
jgi:hypothetical protein